DKRADLWAFGAVVYEMLTGRRAFPGDNVSEILAQVLLEEPDWKALPAITPEPIHRLLRRTSRRIANSDSIPPLSRGSKSRRRRRRRKRARRQRSIEVLRCAGSCRGR